jgi:hypothetical protein
MVRATMLVAAVATALAAGCGSDGGSGSSPSTTPSPSPTQAVSPTVAASPAAGTAYVTIVNDYGEVILVDFADQLLVLTVGETSVASHATVSPSTTFHIENARDKTCAIDRVESTLRKPGRYRLVVRKDPATTPCGVKKLAGLAFTVAPVA